MSEEYTKTVNTHNRNYIQELIDIKNSPYPLYAKRTNVVTDFDVFPYPRFYRGEYRNPNPIVIDREAGWRPRVDRCYRGAGVPKPLTDPSHCFEGSCSLVVPCTPAYLNEIGNNDELAVQLQDKCTNQYR